MNKGNHLSAILRSEQSVFTTEDIALLWEEPGSNAARVRLHYYIQRGALYRIRNGLFAKNAHYNRLECATRIFTPAYVSFETVLAREGMLFQVYQSIFVASSISRTLVVDGQSYVFRKMKSEILWNANGVENIDHTWMACKERALLDMLYLKGDYHVDNLRSVNWDRVFDLLPLYRNQRMNKTVQILFQREAAL